MRLALLGAMLVAVLLGCSGAEREIVVTREQYGTAWPLTVNSAKVVCRRGGDLAILKVGTKRYALTEAARAAGYPDAGPVTRADPQGLLEVCGADIAASR